MVPDDPPVSYRMELTIPGCSVKGMVYNKLSGLPVSDEIMGIRGSVMVKGNISVFLQSNSVLWRGAGPFQVIGIPPGEYTFGILAPGYKMYLGNPFSLTEGEELDLGKIMLEPTGMVDLEVVGPSGDPVHFTVYCEGRNLGQTTGDFMRLPNGKERYWTLPLDSATLMIKSRGYKDKEITVQMEPQG
jgi:hypothetical protein